LFGTDIECQFLEVNGCFPEEAVIKSIGKPELFAPIGFILGVGVCTNDQAGN